MNVIPEVDFGVWWRLHDDRPWRVSWNQQTGVLYAVQQGTAEQWTLAVLPDRRQVEALLDGWADPASPIYCNLLALLQRIGKLDHEGG
jgi:hypothetical protein